MAEHHKYDQLTMFVKNCHAPSNMLSILYVLFHPILKKSNWKQLGNSHKIIHVAQEEQELKPRFI